MLSVKICRPDTGATGYITELDLSSLSTKYRVTNIDGIDYVDSNILSDKVSQHYGSIYRGWSVADREITIDIVPIGDIQTNRRELLSFFNNRSVYRLELTDGVYSGNPPAGATAWINGYIRTIDYSNYQKPQGIKLIFVCPYPYFTRRSLGGGNSLSYLLKRDMGLSNAILKEQLFFEMAVDNRYGLSYGITSILDRETVSFTLTNSGNIPTGFIFAYYTHIAGYISVGDIRTRDIPANTGVIIDTRPTFKGIWLIQNGVIERKNNILAAGSRWTLCGVGDTIITASIPIRANVQESFVRSLSPEFEGL